MFELSVDGHFDAAHALRGYQGACARVHGHTWLVTVSVRVTTLGGLGMGIDFKELQAVLDDDLDTFDHGNLNDLVEFRDLNPTAENIARLLFDRLSARINNDVLTVFSVTVGESERCRVTYRNA